LAALERTEGAALALQIMLRLVLFSVIFEGLGFD
jgi:hypothetical protein